MTEGTSNTNDAGYFSSFFGAIGQGLGTAKDWVVNGSGYIYDNGIKVVIVDPLTWVGGGTWKLMVVADPYVTVGSGIVGGAIFGKAVYGLYKHADKKTYKKEFAASAVLISYWAIRTFEVHTYVTSIFSSTPKVEDTKPKTEDTKPKTEDTKPKTEDTKTKTEDTKTKTEDTKTKTEDTKTKTEDTKPRMEDVKVKIEEFVNKTKTTTQATRTEEAIKENTKKQDNGEQKEGDRHWVYEWQVTGLISGVITIVAFAGLSALRK